MASPNASSEISSEILPETSSLNVWHSPIESTDDRGEVTMINKNNSSNECESGGGGVTLL